jgi:cell cycle arrest protein BUB2
MLLNAPFVSTDTYLGLLHRGSSPSYSKIRNDTFRTLATDPLFRRRVSEASLIRLLNAIAWRMQDLKEERAELTGTPKFTHTANAVGSPKLESATPVMKSRARALTLTTEGSDTGNLEPGAYVQGMNVLAAPFLYAARSEAEAFAAFSSFITTDCPGYIRGAMTGVHQGMALVDKNQRAEIYCFPSVLTLCACTPPLPQVLRLWDFLFAYGTHLNILCIVAQLVILRNIILKEPK